MKIVCIICSTQTRTTGYISKTSRITCLNKLKEQGSINNLTPIPETILYSFEPDISKLKEIEQVLNRAGIKYRKEI